MTTKVTVFLIHLFVHVFLYLIPWFLHTLLVKLPVTLWECLTGRRPYTYSRAKERHIDVTASKKDTQASDRLLWQLGLNHDMTYRAPLYNGDIQTVLGTILGNMSCGRRVPYKRELLDGFDGNPICLDWLAVPEGVTAKGVIFVIPGIGNYSQTPYVQRLAFTATKRGFHICILSPRGMGSAPLTQPRLTCITFTADAQKALRERFTHEQIRARFGADLPVLLLGFSGGATTMVKTMAEEFAEFQKDPSCYPGGFPVKALVSMNAPYNMFMHHKTVEDCAFYYQKPLVESMHKYALKHSEIFLKGLPGLTHFEDKVELELWIKQMTGANDFNEHLVAPHFGYEEGAVGYYKDAAAFKWLEKTDASIPVVCVESKQDPITGVSHTDEEWQELADKHPNVVLVQTPVGGHLGYLANPIDAWRQKNSFLIDFPLHVFQHAIEKNGKPEVA